MRNPAFQRNRIFFFQKTINAFMFEVLILNKKPENYLNSVSSFHSLSFCAANSFQFPFVSIIYLHLAINYSMKVCIIIFIIYSNSSKQILIGANKHLLCLYCTRCCHSCLGLLHTYRIYTFLSVFQYIINYIPLIAFTYHAIYQAFTKLNTYLSENMCLSMSKSNFVFNCLSVVVKVLKFLLRSM